MQFQLYHEILKQGAYRWLHSIDLREFSVTKGFCDREYWAWKTKVFSNGTLQGGLAGFLDCRDILDLTSDQIKNVVKCVTVGSSQLQRSNGSYEEAYPLESSYAVTGLVLYFLMYSRLKYPQYFDSFSDEHLKKIAIRAKEFLKYTPETHGVISNHIATTELALALTSVWLNEPLEKMTVFDHQNEEGGFQEYQGVDPGYQTLLESYFAGAIPFLPQDYLKLDKLRLSRAFTTCFRLPNGGYSGEIGSRGTGIFYPGSLAIDCSENDSLWFLNLYLPSINSVTPLTADINNFVPVFNSWAMFRGVVKNLEVQKQVSYSTKNFPISGFFVNQNQNEHFILSLKNCNWRHVVFRDNQLEDKSVSILKIGTKVLSHAQIDDFDKNKITLIAQLQSRQKQKLNSMLTNSLLHLLAVLFFWFPQLQRALKQFLAGYVMGRNAIDNEAKITLSIHWESPFRIEYSSPNVSLISYGFKSHMASANNFEKRSL